MDLRVAWRRTRGGNYGWPVVPGSYFWRCDLCASSLAAFLLVQVRLVVPVFVTFACGEVGSSAADLSKGPGISRRARLTAQTVHS